MTNEEKLKLITRNLEETLTKEELKALIASETPIKAYIGYEISGKPHLGSGLLQLQIVKDLVDAGVECTIFIADWHTWINKKLDGEFETIHRLGRDFWKEAMIAGYLCIGGNPNDLHFIQGTDLYKENPDYWTTMVEVSQNTTLARMQRSITIAGKKEGDSVDFALLLYPAMQAADIFTMQINLAFAGMDQRKAHVIAKDVAMAIKTHPLKDSNGNQIKPVAIHNHLLMGLTKPSVWPIPEEKTEEIKTALKMSKSIPGSAVFIFDEPEVIQKKLNDAFAPEGETSYNPVLDWVKHLIFFEPTTFTISRDEKWGGDLEYTTYEDLEKDYAEKKLHPQDLKKAVAQWLIEKLEPARKYFEDPKRKAALEEIERLTVR